MPKHVSVRIELRIGDEEPPAYRDHYVALADKDIANLLALLNDTASAAARTVDAELRFQVEWDNTIRWDLDRPSDHPAPEVEAPEQEVDVA